MKSKFKFQVFLSCQDRKTNLSLCFSWEVTTQQFCFYIYWPLEQLEFILEKVLGFRKMQENLGKKKNVFTDNNVPFVKAVCHLGWKIVSWEWILFALLGSTLCWNGFYSGISLETKCNSKSDAWSHPYMILAVISRPGPTLNAWSCLYWIIWPSFTHEIYC